MKVLVCGGRDYTDEMTLFDVLDQLRHQHHIRHIIHGNANGADSMAGKWARINGVQEVVCPANWDKFGKSAGNTRNERMLELSPDMVVAFPGGRGTADMVSKANWAGVYVRRVGESSYE